MFGHMFLENYLFHNKGEDCMNQDKIEIQHINYLRSMLNLRLSLIDDWTQQQNVIEIVGEVIDAYCLLIGQEKSIFIQEFPFVERELLGNVHQNTFLTIQQEGELLTKDDEKTIQTKRKKMSELKANLKWNNWDAYKEHLLKTKEDMTMEVVEDIDRETDNIVMNIPVPKEEKEFFIKGLVVGNVQSGKTLNYSGVINKAIDIGYDIIIVLSGVPASLRNQTQRRMEMDVVGVDSLTGHTIGIGNCFSKPSNIEMYTKQDIIKEQWEFDNENALENKFREVGGDFNLIRVSHLPVYRGNKQIVIVSKKHSHVLSAIKRWLETLPLINQETGKLEKLSLLLLNDESDNATINSHKNKGERSSINGLVRDILGLFNKRVVCGYTATPFADIYSDSKQKDDLFPSDFMYLLKSPPTYMGPFEFFGVNYKGESVPRMPLVRHTKRLDSSQFVEGDTLYNWDYKVNGVNPSLVEAINSFILSGAIRILRGQGEKHHSMMVHISTRVSSHDVVTQAIQNYINKIKESQIPQFWKSIEELWNDDYVVTSEKMENLDTSLFKTKVKYDMNFTFSDIMAAVKQFIAELQEVRKINGESDDKLDFHRAENALKIICVGGAILGRGYTIEGLSCSYFARNSLHYDTMLQCGRFYGYRKGYRDLVRVYTTQEIDNDLQESAKALFSLSNQLEAMAKEKSTPEQFGLYIDTCKKKLYKPTAKNRQRAAYTVNSNYSGKSKDVAAFLADDEITEQNRKVANQFIELLGEPTNVEQTSWHAIATQLVIDFLMKYKYSYHARFCEPTLLQKYLLEIMNEYGSTLKFDVAIPKLSRGGEDGNIGGYPTKTAKRSCEVIQTGEEIHYVLSQGRALTGRHLKLGLTDSEKTKLEKKYPILGNEIHTDEEVREFRGNRGQLILYSFCIEPINKQLNKYGKYITESPIGFHFNLPYCQEYGERESLVNEIYYLNQVLGGNVV